MQPFSAILKTGKEITGSLDRKDDDAGELDDNRTAYGERSDRHGYERHYDERPATARLASRWEEPEGTARQGFDSSTDSPGSGPVNNGAPDDELHRQTTASCASCH